MWGSGVWFIACMIAILLWRDYSRFAMRSELGGSRAALRRETFETISRPSRATTIPATTSSQKWFAVAMTQNQTHAGHSAQSTFAGRLFEARKRKMPTISASAACRLGIAANGFARAPTTSLWWLTPSTKPYDGNIHGGAVGTSA